LRPVEDNVLLCAILSELLLLYLLVLCAGGMAIPVGLKYYGVAEYIYRIILDALKF
jgi:hypothetical protein